MCYTLCWHEGILINDLVYLCLPIQYCLPKSLVNCKSSFVKDFKTVFTYAVKYCNEKEAIL